MRITHQSFPTKEGGRVVIAQRPHPVTPIVVTLHDGERFATEVDVGNGFYFPDVVSARQRFQFMRMKLAL
tara:strand:- start:28 stop:237 length:210 start_codon:yes stop_codon:yes gene_type:complete